MASIESLLYLLWLLFLNVILFFNLFLFLLYLLFFLYLIVIFIIIHFLSLKSHFCYGIINDYGSTFVLALIQLFNRFLAGSIFSEFDKCKSFVTFLIIGIYWYLNFSNLTKREEQFSEMLFSNVKYEISYD